MLIQIGEKGNQIVVFQVKDEDFLSHFIMWTMKHESSPAEIILSAFCSSPCKEMVGTLEKW